MGITSAFSTLNSTALSLLKTASTIELGLGMTTMTGSLIMGTDGVETRKVEWQQAQDSSLPFISRLEHAANAVFGKTSFHDRAISTPFKMGARFALLGSAGLALPFFSNSGSVLSYIGRSIISFSLFVAADQIKVDSRPSLSANEIKLEDRPERRTDLPEIRPFKPKLTNEALKN